MQNIKDKFHNVMHRWFTYYLLTYLKYFLLILMINI
jgi:hypothetical protein